MIETRPAALSGAPEVTRTAKAALRRLALEKLEPTPENYARAYRLEGGEPSTDDAAALAALIERIVRGVERGGRHWTAARKKDSLQRVLDGSRSDARRLQQRLSQLVTSWGSDSADSGIDTGMGLAEIEPDGECVAPAEMANPVDRQGPAWRRAVELLGEAVQQALPAHDGVPHELAVELARLTGGLSSDAVTAPQLSELEAFCGRAIQALQRRHHLFEQLGALCRELTEGLTDLAEDDSWAKGQVEAMRVKIDEGLTARGVRGVSELLRTTREHQNRLRLEREQARDSLKGLIHRMLSELDELGSQTGHFHDSVGRYADVIERADSLESLAGTVREMVEESRSVQALVQQTQARLQEEHGRARGLTERIVELEAEMRRLSDEVSTDQLTQIANRRGLQQAFEAARARLQRSGGALAIALLDIDNFKRLNDELGHVAGDEALKSLAARVSEILRPSDVVARYGGEEFVVLLPDTLVDDAQQILTRLQRSLSSGLFMHRDQQVFVTFSAGVTAWRESEALEVALERADQALYEAKRTGKNRTCAG